jgi:hypothetical protein
MKLLLDECTPKCWPQKAVHALRTIKAGEVVRVGLMPKRSTKRLHFVPLCGCTCPQVIPYCWMHRENQYNGSVLLNSQAHVPDGESD